MKKEEAKRQVLASSVYESGDSFTASMFVTRCDLNVKQMRFVLEELVAEGLLVYEIINERHTFKKPKARTGIMDRKLTNYVPPKPAKYQHLNPWISIDWY